MVSAPDILPSLLPVGLFVGTFDDDDLSQSHEIRRGTEVHDVSDDEFVAWVAAHGTDDTPESGPATRELLERTLADGEMVTPASVLDGLVDRGLLVALADDGTDAEEFARTHRAVPMLVGLGNSAETPELFSIGLIGHPVIEVSRPVFELWAWADVDGDIWSACESFAEQEREAGATDPDLCEPERVLAGFLVALTGLLAAQAVHLDIVRPGVAVEGPR
jgi:hypothetical protein